MDHWTLMGILSNPLLFWSSLYGQKNNAQAFPMLNLEQRKPMNLQEWDQMLRNGSMGVRMPMGGSVVRG